MFSRHVCAHIQGERRERDIRRSVQYAREQHEAAGNLPVPKIRRRQLDAVKVSIVGAVQEDIVDASHAQEERYQGDGGHPVLGEQALSADEATDDAQADDARAEGRRPPADKEGWLVEFKVAEGRRVRVERHGCRFLVGRRVVHARRPPQRARRARGRATVDVEIELPDLWRFVSLMWMVEAGLV